MEQFLSVAYANFFKNVLMIAQICQKFVCLIFSGKFLDFNEIW